MQSALYFAFIRGREGEIRALRALSPLACARMATVVDLPTMKEGSNKSTELHINSFARYVRPGQKWEYGDVKLAMDLSACVAPLQLF